MRKRPFMTCVSGVLLVSAASLVAGSLVGMPAAAVATAQPLSPAPLDPFASPTATHGLQDVSALSADDAWAVGARSVDGSRDLTWARHWDGTVWSPVPSPSPGAADNELLSVAAISASDVWAVGTMQDQSGGPNLQLIEHWDGISWTVVKPPIKFGWMLSIDAPGVDDVWVAGVGAEGAVAEHWNGSAWTVIKAATPPVSPPWYVTSTLFYGIRAVSPRDVWAVGDFDAQTESGGYDRQPLIEHWNGKRWSVQKLSHQPSFTYLFDVDETSPNDVWAAGTVDFGYKGDTLVEHWDGHSWIAQTTSYGTGSSYLLSGITAISPNDAWAVGYGRHGFQYHTVTQHWDGRQWTVVPAVERSPHHDFLGDVTAVRSDDVITVGGLRRGTRERSLAERWDGSSWQLMP